MNQAIGPKWLMNFIKKRIVQKKLEFDS